MTVSFHYKLKSNLQDVFVDVLTTSNWNRYVTPIVERENLIWVQLSGSGLIDFVEHIESIEEIIKEYGVVRDEILKTYEEAEKEVYKQRFYKLYNLIEILKDIKNNYKKL